MPEFKRLRVFVVDDEPIIGFTLATILESAAIPHGQIPIPLKRSEPQRRTATDCLISDVMMPQLNGIDLGIQSKAIYPNVRVLMFSGVAASANLVGRCQSQQPRLRYTRKAHPPEGIAGSYCGSRRAAIA
jgi:DNA-binding NtrC family response regulator